MNLITKTGTMNGFADYFGDDADIEFLPDTSTGRFLIGHENETSSASSDTYVDVLSISPTGTVQTKFLSTPQGGDDEELDGIEVLTDGTVVTVYTSGPTDQDVLVKITNTDGSTTTKTLLNASVGADYISVQAMTDGNFALLYEDNSGTGYTSNVAVYDKSGNLAFGPNTLPTAYDYLADDVYSTQSATFQLKDGGFAIAYQDADVVKYISFTATGNINKTTTVFDAGSDTIYDVAATQLRGGNIVVVYEYETSTGPSQLMGHIITPDGTPVSGPTMLSDINTGTYNEYPDVAATADGGFVVVWNHDDTDDIGYMRRFDAAMVPFGASERVSNSTNPDEEDFKVAIAPDGSMLVTWNDGQADELRTQAYAVEHVASPFDDNLKGTNAADTIDLGAGNDTYDGMGGDDVMNGGDGNDDMRGSQGNDTMNGDGDEDKMLGGKGDDTMYGGDGNDTMKGKSGDDTMYGGDGNDTMNGSKGNDTMYGGAGEDIMKGSIGVDKMYGDADNDDMKGNAGNDKMYGGLGDDTMKGGKGNDTMYGGDKPNTPEGDIKDGGDIMEGANGNDTIYGGAGGDKITGGKGNDVMTGGDGKDTFIFKAKHGQDTITDFNLKQDDIEIRAYLINQHVAAKQVGSDTVLEYGAAYDHDGKASTDKIYSQVTFEDMNLTKTLQELGITQADLDPFLM